MFTPFALVFTTFLLPLFATVVTVESHGFLCFPPSRNAAWMCGFPQDSPKDYDQMALNAGGVRTVYPNYPERCPITYGVCGDPTDREQIHAAGGIHDRGVRAVFNRGEEVAVQVNLTSYHKGAFYFQLCRDYPETEACFNTISAFSIEDTSTEGGNPNYIIPVKLPNNLTCEHCVFRWFWITNNSPGLPPELFINCADISIT